MRRDFRLLKMPLFLAGIWLLALISLIAFRIFHPIIAVLFMVWVLIDGPLWIMSLLCAAFCIALIGMDGMHPASAIMLGLLLVSFKWMGQWKSAPWLSKPEQ